MESEPHGAKGKDGRRDLKSTGIDEKKQMVDNDFGIAWT